MATAIVHSGTQTKRPRTSLCSLRGLGVRLLSQLRQLIDEVGALCFQLFHHGLARRDGCLGIGEKA